MSITIKPLIKTSPPALFTQLCISQSAADIFNTLSFLCLPRDSFEAAYRGGCRWGNKTQAPQASDGRGWACWENTSPWGAQKTPGVEEAGLRPTGGIRVAGPKEGGLTMGPRALSLPTLRQTVLPGSFGCKEGVAHWSQKAATVGGFWFVLTF